MNATDNRIWLPKFKSPDQWYHAPVAPWLHAIRTHLVQPFPEELLTDDVIWWMRQADALMSYGAKFYFITSPLYIYDKLMSDEMNNPVNDCEKARELLFDEMTHWHNLPERRKRIYASLLTGIEEFDGFMQLVGAERHAKDSVAELIRAEFAGMICANAPIQTLASKYPCALAYALALIDTSDQRSVTPAWVLYHYPEVEYVMRRLRHTRCAEGCDYCNQQLDARYNLKRFFGYEAFRTYDGEPLQEKAACAAIDGQSLLAIFPTGGGKSLTFQLPALMEGGSVHGLTVVISPLQSLMKDQVDNLADRGITDAVTINGLLDPISRSLAIERVQGGDASLLYISPEMLRLPLPLILRILRSPKSLKLLMR